MRKLAYYLLCALMSPVIVVGYLVWVGKIAAAGRSGVSGSAQGPLTVRFTEHRLGTRPDEPADRLIRVLPGISPPALRLMSGPLLLAHRLTGYVPVVFRYPFEGEVPPRSEASARIWFFDAALDRYLPEVAQFVSLGAGFDTRPYRLPERTPVRLFEVDTPGTQAVKRATLAAAGIDAGARTLFLWEGVTMYLEPAAVEDTLRKIGSTAPGSVVAFDYFTTEALESRSLY